MSKVQYTQGLIAPLVRPVDSELTNDTLDAMESDLLVNYAGTIVYSRAETRVESDGPGMTVLDQPESMLDAFMVEAHNAGLVVERAAVRFYASAYSDNTDDYMATSRIQEGKIVMGD